MINNRKARVMLVEDNLGDIYLTQEAIREGNLPIELQVVMDGKEAISFLNKSGKHSELQTPDLILLDLNIPLLDGKEVLKQIKTNPTTRAIPVIILTSSDAFADVQACFDLYANAYVIKPIDFDDFFFLIKQIYNFWLTTCILPSRLIK